MSAEENRKNVFAWLKQVQKRPGMYVGNSSSPLQDLETLVHGYCTALHVHGPVENVPSMVHFSTWLRHKRGWSMSCGWASAITDHSEPEEALRAFFSLANEFSALTPTKLSTVWLSERNQPTGKRARIGFEGTIARPDQIDVIRYAPEPIHFLRFHYGLRAVDQHTLYTSEGSDSTTLDNAKEWVRDEFSVDLCGWRDNG